jgi:hypothetical protein
MIDGTLLVDYILLSIIVKQKKKIYNLLYFKKIHGYCSKYTNYNLTKVLFIWSMGSFQSNRWEHGAGVGPASAGRPGNHMMHIICTVVKHFWHWHIQCSDSTFSWLLCSIFRYWVVFLWRKGVFAIHFFDPSFDVKLFDV